MGRAINAKQLASKKFDILQFDSPYKQIMGCPERKGNLFIYGDSGEGKTRFTLDFAKYLTMFGKVLYNSLEEGECESQRIAWEETGMIEVSNRINLLDKEPMDELAMRLRKSRSPSIVVLDSWQYMRMSFQAYLKWRGEFNDKLFIIISQVEGRKPKGKSADAVRFDSSVKLHVDRYIVFPKSRYGGNTPFIIWEEKARELHGDPVVDRIMSKYQ